MHRATSAILAAILGVGVAFIGPAARTATAQAMAKAQVASLITRVENGVDEFRNYLEKRGENASDAKSTAQSSQGDARARAPLRIRKPRPTRRRTRWTTRSVI